MMLRFKHAFSLYFFLFIPLRQKGGQLGAFAEHLPSIKLDIKVPQKVPHFYVGTPGTPLVGHLLIRKNLLLIERIISYKQEIISYKQKMISYKNIVPSWSKCKVTS